MKQITKDIKVLLPRILIILAIIVLVALSTRFILDKLNSGQAEEDTAKSEEADLTRKFKSLSALQGENFPTGSVSAAIPNDNSSFLAISQLEQVAAENSVILSSTRVGPESSGSGTFHSDINLEVEAPFAKIAAFVKSISQVAPLMRVKSVKSLQVKETNQATIIVATYWAPFPTQLPPISKELLGPTDAEQEMLTKLSSLKKPAFEQTVTPQPPTSRVDPFSI